MRPIVAILFLFSCGSALSQGSFQPLGSDSYHILDRFNIKYGSGFSLLHPTSKPYSKKYIGSFISYLDSFESEMSIVDQKNLYYLKLDNAEWLREPILSKKPIAKYFYREPADLYSVNTKDFILKVNPVLQFSLSREKDNSDFLFHNTRGLELRAYIKRKVGFYTYLTENQMRLPLYSSTRIDERQAVPGEGFYKNFRTNAYDYFSASGYVTFNVIDHFDIQFGHGKNFIGNGHRSILLSDFSNNYFYLKIQTSVWKIRYQNIFAEMEQQYERGADKLLEKKYAAFHHLNIDVTPWLDIGVFEGVIFNRSEHFELQYLNPLIFYRSIEQELGSP
ncbi:MAG: hypothetical protein HKN92_09105, partial [Chitinophagales bacterium]|nr:hypothetical protein [Chitinophagales bacterium]